MLFEHNFIYDFLRPVFQNEKIEPFGEILQIDFRLVAVERLPVEALAGHIPDFKLEFLALCGYADGSVAGIRGDTDILLTCIWHGVAKKGPETFQFACVCLEGSAGFDHYIALDFIGRIMFQIGQVHTYAVS